MNKLLWLMRREYWEHRGGLRTVPLVSAGVLGLAVFVALIVGIRDHGPHLRIAVEHGGDALSAGLATALSATVLPFSLILAIVVFFYLLSALYDDRRDRSVLFWNSLPISAEVTVASKALTALVTAPALMLAAIGVFHLAAAVLLTGVFWTQGISHGVLPQASALLEVWGRMLAAFPIQVLWSLPTVGWLLAVSSWCRSKPFLWAILLPAGAALTLAALNGMGVTVAAGWGRALSRLCGSLLPVSWAAGTPSGTATWGALSDRLASADLWWGAAAGTALLAVAVAGRRRSVAPST